VTGVDSFDFSLINAGTTVAGASVMSVAGTGTTYTVSVNTGTGSGTLRLDLIDDDTITDALSNSLGGAGLVNGDFTTGENYTIDKTPPAVVSIVRASVDPTTASLVDFTVTFSEIVTGVDSFDFSLTNAGTTVTGASISSVVGTGTTYTVTVNTGTGSGTLRLDLIDDDSIMDALSSPLGGAGLGNGDFATGENYTIDRTPPAVVSIVRASVDPTTASLVDFTVTFSESVTGVDSLDFSVTNAGTTVTGASVMSVAGTGTTYTVTVNTGTGSGTLRLDLIDDDTITDALSNSLGGAGLVNGDFATGENYTIDRTPPAVVSIVRASVDPAASTSLVDFTVTFSESVTGVDSLDFSLTNAGTTVTGASISSVVGTGTTYTVTVYTGMGPGTLHLDLIDDDSIMDALSSPLGGAGLGNGDFITGETYNVL
jgi:hypothetical protein